MDISVIIVNYNTMQMTAKCVDSLFKFTKGVSFEIIVVDNNSKDGSRELFTNDKRIKYIYLEKNLGFGRANNKGLKYATGDYIFLLNSDTLILNNVLYIFYQSVLQAPSDTSCLGTIMLDRNKKNVYSYGDFPTYWSELTIKFGKKLMINSKGPIGLYKDYPNNDKYIPVDCISGADMFIPRRVITNFNLFDDDFFLYYEETEMQFRYKKNGLQSYIVKGPEIVHYGGETIKKETSLLQRSYDIRSSLLYFKKTRNCTSYVLYKSLLFFLLSSLWFHPKYSFSDKYEFFRNII